MDFKEASRAFGISSASVTSMRIHCRPPDVAGWEESPTDRQERLEWFDQGRLSKAKATLFGLGVGSRVAELLARKGIGALDLVDHDIVMPSNLNRTFYFAGDVGKPKALALARNLQMVAVHSTLLRAVPTLAEEYLQRGPAFDVAVCLVDDEKSRECVSRALLSMAKPCIFGAASADANSCRVFVQEPGKACYGCSGGFGGGEPCGPLPAVSDVQAVLASLIVYVIDTLLMPRPRHWNLRQILLSGGEELRRNLPQDPGCRVCGTRR